MLGKLKRSLKERCPECGRVLQIRVMENQGFLEGEPIVTLQEYICCSNRSCDYERSVPRQKKHRKQIKEE